jgi:NAD(P)H-dependent FMN reductase
VARWIEVKLLNRNHTVFYIDPLELKIPLLDRMYKGMHHPSEALQSLRNQIREADGYLQITPEYNRSTSSAMKNTLDYFLEEYYFKPSAIVSYSQGAFGGINASRQLRLVFAELGAPSIPSSFSIPRVHTVFRNDGKLLDDSYDKRVVRFFKEFEWYIEAVEKQRKTGVPY